jgi:hypothetical protein
MHSLLTKLTFQDRDLMPKSEDLHVFIPVTHRQQPQHRERVRDGQVAQSQQHEPTSCRAVDSHTQPAHTAPVPATTINTATPAHQPR